MVDRERAAVELQRLTEWPLSQLRHPEADGQPPTPKLRIWPILRAAAFAYITRNVRLEAHVGRSNHKSVRSEADIRFEEITTGAVHLS